MWRCNAIPQAVMCETSGRPDPPPVGSSCVRFERCLEKRLDDILTQIIWSGHSHAATRHRIDAEGVQAHRWLEGAICGHVDVGGLLVREDGELGAQLGQV